MKKIWRLLWSRVMPLVFFLLVSLLVKNPAKAADVLMDEVTSEPSGWSSTFFNYNNGYNKTPILYNWSATQNNISKINLYSLGSYMPGSKTFLFEIYPTGATTSPIFSQQFTIDMLQGSIFSIIPSSPIPVDIGSYYDFDVSQVGGCGSSGAIGSCISLKTFLYNLPPTYEYYSWYQIYYNDNYVPANTLQLIYPASGDSLGGMSVDFSYKYTNPTNLYDYAVLEINNVVDGYSFFEFDKISTTTSEVTKHFTKPIVPGSWQWNGYMLNSITLATSTTTEWNDFTFASSSVTNLDFLLEQPTEDTVCAGMDTTTYFGSLNCAIRMAFTWLFFPDKKNIESFYQQTNDLKRSFPFSAYYDLTDTINTAVSSSTLDMNGSIGMPMIRKTATSSEYYILPVISSTTMSTVIGSDNNTLFRNSITWILWSLVAVFIIFRLTK